MSRRKIRLCGESVFCGRRRSVIENGIQSGLLKYGNAVKQKKLPKKNVDYVKSGTTYKTACVPLLN